MKLRLPFLLLSLLSSLWLLPSRTIAAETNAGKTLHIYLLTGQSNSLGSVKGDPAGSDLLDQYASGVQFWNGSVASNAPADPNASWTTVAPHLPNYSGNNCMGPEYGFSHMMQRKGWQMSDTDEIRVIKISRDGGGNSYWVKGGANSIYNSILSSVREAVNALDDAAYDRIDISGLLYLQGESNNRAETDAAQQRFQDLVSNLKSDLTAEGFDSSKVTVSLNQSVLGQPASWNGGEKSAVGSDGRSTQVVLRELADTSENIGWVTTRDLDKINPGDGMGVHYNGKAQITIGARYAYAMALGQGMDVTDGGTLAVRNGEFENGASLNEASSWWGWRESGRTVDELASAVASWDVSSANVEESLTGNLALGGILVEDPYRPTISIKRAAGSPGATLSLGSRGIELRGGNLALGTNVSTTASQRWMVAGGHTLSLGEEGAEIAFSGEGSLSISRSGEGIADVSLHASALTEHQWSVGDGVRLHFAGAADFSSQSVALEEGATVSLGVEGSPLGSLTLGEGATLEVGASGVASSLSVGALSLGGAVMVNLDILSASAYDSLSVSSWDAVAPGATVNFNINYDEKLRGNRSYTLFSGWNNEVSFTYNAWLAGDGQPMSSLSEVDGNLVLTLGNLAGSVSYEKDFPTETQTVTAGIALAGVYDASLQGDNTVTTRNNVNSGDVRFFSCQQNAYEGNVYAEARGITAASFVAFGSDSASSRYGMTGDVYLKVGGEGVSSGAARSNVWGVLHGDLHGDLYIELDNPDVAYNQVYASYDGDVDGASTMVVKGGTASSFVIAGVACAAKTIGGGTYLQVDGGSFSGGVFAGNGATGATINGGSHLLINGGVFTKGVVTAGNLSNGGIVNGGASLMINGGVFGGATVSGAGAGIVNGGVTLNITDGDFTGCSGIYAGSVRTSNATAAGRKCSVSGGTEVILSCIDDANPFASYTGIVSGGSLHADDEVSGTKKLVLDAYTVSRMAHVLKDFDEVELIAGSATSLSQENTLGGATHVSLAEQSSLNCHVAGEATVWDTGASVSVEGGSTLTKDGEGRLSLVSLSGAGSMHVVEGSASLGSLTGYSGTLKVEGGSTAFVEAGAGSLGVLSGSGRVELEGLQDGSTSFGFENWKGTVKLTELQQAESNGHVVYNLSHFGCSGSTIELDGVGLGHGDAYVYLNGSEVAANLHLAGTEENNHTGLYLTAGSSSATYQFSGDWSGDGDFCFTPKTANVKSTFRFLGNMMGYEGDYLVRSGATLAFGDGGTGSAVGSISGTGVIRGLGNGAAYTTNVVYNYGGEVTASTRLTGNVSLTHAGRGYLTLTGKNDYTGATTIQAGRMFLQGEGTLGTGTVSVASASGGLQLGDGALILASDTAATLSGHAVVSAMELSGTQGRAATLANARMSVTGELKASHVQLENTVVSVDTPGGLLHANDVRLGEGSSLVAGESAVTMTAREGKTGRVCGQVASSSFSGASENAPALLSGVSVEVKKSFSMNHIVLEDALLDIARDQTLSLTSVQVLSSTRITDAPASVLLRDVTVYLDSTNTTSTQGLLSGEKTLYQTGNLSAVMTIGSASRGVEYTALSSSTFDSVTLTGSDMLLDFSSLEDSLAPGLVSFTFNGGTADAWFEGQELVIRALYGGRLWEGWVDDVSGRSGTVWFEFVPEPTTPMLSLLTLVAWFVRRRRA